ncbi:MAG: hypothetical protein M0R06_09010 [Sphaerochaeta sp.]|jgi:hypothetical protein|nr:hypothetical protein [Sphaerochaeta sp.]
MKKYKGGRDDLSPLRMRGKMNDNKYAFLTSSGVELEIRKISPLLLVRMNAEFPPPKPPVQEVATASGGTIRESNPASPEYLEQMREYEQAQMERTQRLITKRGIVRRELSAEELARVQELRAYWREEFDGAELEQDDWLAFVNYVAIETQQDLEGVIGAVTRYSQPTEAGVSEHTESFRN